MYTIVKSLFIIGLSSLALVQASPTKRADGVWDTIERQPRLVRRIYNPNFDEGYRGPREAVPAAQSPEMEYLVCMYKFIYDQAHYESIAAPAYKEQHDAAVREVYRRGDEYCNEKAIRIWGRSSNRRLSPDEIKAQVATLKRMSREYREAGGEEGRGNNGGEGRKPPSNDNKSVHSSPSWMDTARTRFNSFRSRMKLGAPVPAHQQPGTFTPGKMPGGAFRRPL